MIFFLICFSLLRGVDVERGEGIEGCRKEGGLRKKAEGDGCGG